MSRYVRRWTTLALCLLVGASPMAQAAAPVVAVRLVMTDVQGTPVMKKNLQGHILARYDYRPYGVQQGGPVEAGPGYTGHVNDPQTGLVYMQQRYYDPAIGRFLSVDPVATVENPAAAFNRYWYANNNTLRFVDLDGRLPILVPVAVIAWRAYSAYDTATSTANNVRTLADTKSSIGEKIAAGAELAGSLLGGK